MALTTRARRDQRYVNINSCALGTAMPAGCMACLMLVLFPNNETLSFILIGLVTFVFISSSVVLISGIGFQQLNRCKMTAQDYESIPKMTLAEYAND